MAATRVKVEIRFNGTDWVDVSDRCLLPNGISIQRGRGSETGDAVAVGTCSLTLSNDDGAFSPELASSPYYPHVAEGVALRVSAWVAIGGWRTRFYGTVQSWSVSWLDAEGGRLSVCRVTANDTLGSLPSYVFRQASEEVIRRLPALQYYWPLRDSGSPATALAGDVAMADNGADGWASGGRLAMDDGTDTHPLFTSGSGGLTLTSGDLSTDRTWRLGIVVLSKPTAACSIVRLHPMGAQIAWNGTNFTYNSGAGAEVLPTAPTTWPVLLTVASRVGAFTPAYCAWQDAAGARSSVLSDPLDRLRRIVINPTLSGGSQWSAGHVFVQDLAPDDDGDLRPELPMLLLGSRVPPEGVSAVDMLTQWAGLPSGAVTDLPAGTPFPLLDGRDAATVIGAVVTGMGARLVDGLDGTLKWIPFAAAPAPISLPSGEVGTALTWQTDTTGWRSEVTVTWPDGTSYTVTRPDGKRQSDSIEGVHASRAEDRSYADWLVWSPTKARLPQVPYDLSTIPDLHVPTLAAVTPGSRITLTGLPTQMPSTLTCIVEGIEETLTHRDWDLTLKLSPDVVSRLFILDDPVQGVLDGPYVIAP